MIRLSEALAKLTCEEEVTVRHVKEAADLLRTSIVRIEKDDIEVDDEDDEGLNENGELSASSSDRIVRPQDVGVLEGETMDVDGDHVEPTPEQSSGSRRAFQIPIEKFESICGAVIVRLRQKDESDGAGIKLI